MKRKAEFAIGLDFSMKELYGIQWIDENAAINICRRDSNIGMMPDIGKKIS